MKRPTFKKLRNFPVLIELDEDGFYVAECPLFEGCYTQGKTMPDVLKNIREVIRLCLSEKKNRQLFEARMPVDFTFSVVSL